MTERPLAKKENISARINEVAKAMINGKERAEMLRTFAKKWQIAERSVDRYIEKAKPKATELRKLAEKTASDTLVAQTKKAVEQGLKSKTERLLYLQRQIEDSQADIDKGIKTDYVVISGKVKKISKDLTPLDKATIRRVIRELQSEISKIEGDYAPVKQDVKAVVSFSDALIQSGILDD